MGSQKYALDEVLDGLSRGVHHFVVDKSRQLGSTTLWLALSLFWCGVFPGMQGAIIADTEANKEETIRARLEQMIELMPKEYPLPIRRHNKNGIHFQFPDGRESVIQYLVAGTRKGGGSMGRSRSLNFMVATEAAYYGDEAQVDKLKAALSDRHPNRLYIWESTPNGFNKFFELWEDACADELTQRAVFVGWWRNETYSYDDNDPLFERYGDPHLTPEEEQTTEEVKARWGYDITLNQWAWYRHHRNPQGASEVATERVETFLSEYPSTPEEGFRSTGSHFADARMIGRCLETAQRRLFKPFCYDVGDDFRAMRMSEGRRGNRIDLKVWQEPVEGASYIVSGDPAYASSEEADAYCAQVMRCYADKVEQVAEYHKKGISPYQFTWILAHLCGWYVNVRLILEINGPGEAVMTEFRHIRTLSSTGELDAGMADDEKRGNFLARVKTYLYHRPDSLAGGYAIQWKTGLNRTPLLIGLADQMTIGQCDVSSVAALEEIRHLKQTGSVIEPEGRHHDDRVMALALGVRAWMDWERAGLRAAGRTWDTEHRDENKPSGDPVVQYLTYQVNRDLAFNAQRRRMVQARQASAKRAGHWAW